MILAETIFLSSWIIQNESRAPGIKQSENLGFDVNFAVSNFTGSWKKILEGHVRFLKNIEILFDAFQLLELLQEYFFLTIKK
jgi:hypothetical protein